MTFEVKTISFIGEAGAYLPILCLGDFVEPKTLVRVTVEVIEEE